MIPCDNQQLDGKTYSLEAGNKPIVYFLEGDGGKVVVVLVIIFVHLTMRVNLL
jgi:hypothetical protein